MYLTKDGRLFTVSDIRQLDDKTPLPRTQQSAAFDYSLPSRQRGATTVETQKGASVSATKAGAIFGGLGLFCILIGLRKARALRRHGRRL